MNRHKAIAHVAEDSRCHDLYDHLTGTAKRAGEAARHFDSAAWAELAGLWHDLGKYSKAFQDMIRSASGIDAHIETQPGRVDHSTAGALLAMREFGKAGFPLAFVIAGHHARLADKLDLETRLEAKHDLLGKALAMDISKEILAVAKLSPPSFLQAGTTGDAEEKARSQEFWVRMLYSALVDADFLDTEAFHDISAGNRHVQNRSMGEPLVQLKDKFDGYMTKKQEESDDTPVNRIRAEVLKACHEKAVMPQGVFSLTAPTGAGKTLAAMGFALNHAISHGLRRVIVVIPYTSIIEQNAGQYREVFGDANIVEHHANLDPEKEDHRNRLACENWDAPIIVTTSVQFMESLLANRSSRCRKLHNTVALRDVDYVIEAHFVRGESWHDNDNMPKHSDMFFRRLEKGQSFHQPYLGCREFAACVEPAGDGLECRLPEEQKNKDLGWMLHDLDFGPPIRPRFFQARLVDGVMDIPPFEDAMLGGSSEVGGDA